MASERERNVLPKTETFGRLNHYQYWFLINKEKKKVKEYWEQRENKYITKSEISKVSTVLIFH